MKRNRRCNCLKQLCSSQLKFMENIPLLMPCVWTILQTPTKLWKITKWQNKKVYRLSKYGQTQISQNLLQRCGASLDWQSFTTANTCFKSVCKRSMIACRRGSSTLIFMTNWKRSNVQQSYLRIQNLDDSYHFRRRLYPLFLFFHSMIYCKKSYGPVFGKGADLKIHDECNGNFIL